MRWPAWLQKRFACFQTWDDVPVPALPFKLSWGQPDQEFTKTTAPGSTGLCATTAPGLTGLDATVTSGVTGLPAKILQWQAPDPDQDLEAGTVSLCQPHATLSAQPVSINSTASAAGNYTGFSRIQHHAEQGKVPAAC